MTTWDANFEASPADSDEWKYGANKIRELKLAISERLELEHEFKAGAQPFHKPGKCSVLYSGNTSDIAALANMSAGSIAWDTTLAVLKRYSGAAWVALQTDHGQLSGLSDNDHPQYQLANEKANANGIASLNANSKVIQDPANANATPGANQIVLANAAGKISPLWFAGGVTAFALLEDQKAYGTAGGTASNTWADRDLNTEVVDPSNIVTLASNQFTLAAGTYWIEVFTTFWGNIQYRACLFDVTANAALSYSRSGRSGSSYENNIVTIFYGVTIAANNTYSVKAKASAAAASGYGLAANITDVAGANLVETYTQVKILKL